MSLDDYYAYLESKKGLGYLIPHFDLQFGASANSTTLFFLEAPGPQVRQTQVISLSNNDPSARNLKNQLNEAKVPLGNVLLWNIVPWIRKDGTGFDVPTLQDIEDAREYHLRLFQILPRLHTLVFIGRKAQSDMVFYSGHTNYRLLAAYHPSAQAMAVVSRRDDNVAVFKRLNNAYSAESGH